MKGIGERIKEARNSVRLTQVELARTTGLSRSYIGDIEKDRYNPSISTLQLIASATGTPLEALIPSPQIQQTTSSENSISRLDHLVADIPIKDEIKLGDKLKSIRESKGLMQLDVCLALNIKQSTLANYENNRRIPLLAVLITLANYYDISLDYLTGRTYRQNIQAEHSSGDLNEILYHEKIIFNGYNYSLTDEDRNIVMKALEVAFYRIPNKQKRDTSIE